MCTWISSTFDRSWRRWIDFTTLGGALLRNADELLHGVGEPREGVDRHAAGRALDDVHDLVQRAGDRVQVLAVEGGHEVPVELLVNEVRDLVGLVLLLAEPVGDGLEGVRAARARAELGEEMFAVSTIFEAMESR